MANPRDAFVSGDNAGQAFEIAYNHLGVRLGRPLPYTKKILEKKRPATAARWVTKWETLTHSDLPSDQTPNPNQSK